MGNLNDRLPEPLYGVLRNFSLTPQKVVPFKLIYRVQANGGYFALKEIKYPEDEFCYIYAAMEHLAAHGFDRVNRMIITKSCRPYAEYKGKRFFLSRWIEGREADFNQKRDLRIAAKTLAELHQSTKGFVPPPWQGRIKWGTWPENMLRKTEELIKFKKQAERRNGKTLFDLIFLAHADYYVYECKKAFEMLIKAGYEKVDRIDARNHYFCHHDYAHHNVIIDGSGQGHVIDFDYCISDMRCHDLGSLMLRVLKKSKWNFPQAVYALKCYDAFRSVSSHETGVISALLRFPQDFWQVAFAFYVERNQPQERLERKIRSWVLDKEIRETSLNRLAKLM